MLLAKIEQYACGVEKNKQNVEHYILNCRNNRNLEYHEIQGYKMSAF